MFWGASEALDLFQEYISAFQEKPEEDRKAHSKSVQSIEINILLFGSGDPRHIIKTMAKLYKHRSEGIKPIIHFYVIDGCAELVARNIFLLAIALENPKYLSLHKKVNVFMDTYGNSLMRASSYQYMISKCKALRTLLSDDDWRMKLVPFLNINALKRKELDKLGDVFDFWLPKPGHAFLIEQYWTNRVRKLLGTRYDYRVGAFDWDLNMILKERKGQQICTQEYHHWRETGVAYTYPVFVYSKPNKTLAMQIVRNGEFFTTNGYMGDIQTGPFVAFGLTSDEDRLLKSSHGENDYRSTDVTAYNLHQIFHEIANGTPYHFDINNIHKYGTTRLVMPKNLRDDEDDLESISNFEYPWLSVEGVDIHIMLINDVKSLLKRWNSFFDVVFVSCNFFPLLNTEFAELLNEKSLLLLETKFMSTHRADDVKAFTEKLIAYAKSVNLDSDIDYSSTNHQYCVLKFKKNCVH